MAERKPTHILSSYYAPRGAQRMYALGQFLAQMYLSPNDKLIGIIGEAGSGKSALIRGMFPGLELTNDDNGVYVRPLPLLEMDKGFAFFSAKNFTAASAKASAALLFTTYPVCPSLTTSGRPPTSVTMTGFVNP